MDDAGSSPGPNGLEQRFCVVSEISVVRLVLTLGFVWFCEFYQFGGQQPVTVFCIDIVFWTAFFIMATILRCHSAASIVMLAYQIMETGSWVSHGTGVTLGILSSLSRDFILEDVPQYYIIVTIGFCFVVGFAFCPLGTKFVRVWF
jgi:hypothetical protein